MQKQWRVTTFPIAAFAARSQSKQSTPSDCFEYLGLLSGWKHLHFAHIFSFVKLFGLLWRRLWMDERSKERRENPSLLTTITTTTMRTEEDLLPKKCREKSFLVKALLWSFITAFTSTRSTKTKRPSRGSQTPGKLSRKLGKVRKVLLRISNYVVYVETNVTVFWVQFLFRIDTLMY